MHLSFAAWRRPVALVAALITSSVHAADAAAAPAKPAPHKVVTSLIPARPVFKVQSGHVTNYDESKVGSFAPLDALTLDDGERVHDARTWMDVRRKELLRRFETEVFGVVPPRAPSAHVSILSANDIVEDGLAVRKHVLITFGEAADGPHADLVLYVPAGAKGPVPAILQLVFVRGLPSGGPEVPLPDWAAKQVKKTGIPYSEIGPVREILDRGYAYATFRYTDVQPDDKTTNATGVQRLAYVPGQTKPGPSEWGTLTVWAWATSRVMDYLATDPSVDPRRIALVGHSRLGKIALWASAADPRFALVFSSCSGAALSRRDYGETIDDMALHFPFWFAGNFQKYVGHWGELPVDAHELLALSAPRPVFITGGTEDQYSDPRGEFLTEVAAGPIYRLLGARDLGTTQFPPADVALVSGDLGWLYHTGPHDILPADWEAFLSFADRHLKPR